MPKFFSLVLYKLHSEEFLYRVSEKSEKTLKLIKSHLLCLSSASYQAGNTRSGVITEVKHLELNQFYSSTPQ